MWLEKSFKIESCILYFKVYNTALQGIWLKMILTCLSNLVLNYKNFAPILTIHMRSNSSQFNFYVIRYCLCYDSNTHSIKNSNHNSRSLQLAAI